MPFVDTTAVVTGGAQGLGLAIAEALAVRGTKVAIFDLSTDQIAAEVARLRGAGPPSTATPSMSPTVDRSGRRSSRCAWTWVRY